MVQSINAHSSPIVIRMNACAINENNPAFNQTPLNALSKRTRQHLARMLNTKRLLRSEEGYERDWRGIAELSLQKHLREALTVENPIEAVLQCWLKNNPKSAKIGYLEHFLGTIDRWDVCDDIQENLDKDTEDYNIKKQQQQQQQQQLQFIDTNVSQQLQLQQQQQQQYQQQSNNDLNILTTDDVDCIQNGLPLQLYDAFILYADADLNIATEIMTELENNPRYNFKFYLKDRDSLAGIMFGQLQLTRLIEERCKRLIVVLSSDFLQSPENKFLVDYTQSLQIESNTRKIVPLICKENVNIPRTLKMYTPLWYRLDGPFNFWDKLAKAIRDVDFMPIYNVRDLHVKRESPTAVRATATAAATQLSTVVKPESSSNQVPRIIVTDCRNALSSSNVNVAHYEQKTPKKSERRLYKSRVLAQSVGQLHISEAPKSLTTSSVSIISSPAEKTKKKKWYKGLTKLVSRSSNKLPEPC